MKKEKFDESFEERWEKFGIIEKEKFDESFEERLEKFGMMGIQFLQLHIMGLQFTHKSRENFEKEIATFLKKNGVELSDIQNGKIITVLISEDAPKITLYIFRVPLFQQFLNIFRKKKWIPKIVNTKIVNTKIVNTQTVNTKDVHAEHSFEIKGFLLW